ncbi:type III secretion system chaperone [Bordetella muralis]|uniref:type III secretion system chaperone n=1 Tax=Bordetella muralis TaxID=1649130 RepID=UPI0039EECB8C
MSRYEHLLSNYAAILGLEPVQLLLAAQEIVVNGITVSLMPEGDEDIGDIVFCTNLGVPACSESLHVLMLQANALWAGTGGCTLGLQHGTGSVLLAGRTPLPLCHAKGFADMIGAFVDIALRWKSLIEGTTAIELSAPSSPGAAAEPAFA